MRPNLLVLVNNDFNLDGFNKCSSINKILTVTSTVEAKQSH